MAYGLLSPLSAVPQVYALFGAGLFEILLTAVVLVLFVALIVGLGFVFNKIGT